MRWSYSQLHVKNQSSRFHKLSSHVSPVDISAAFQCCFVVFFFVLVFTSIQFLTSSPALSHYCTKSTRIKKRSKAVRVSLYTPSHTLFCIIFCDATTTAQKKKKNDGKEEKRESPSLQRSVCKSGKSGGLRGRSLCTFQGTRI